LVFLYFLRYILVFLFFHQSRLWLTFIVFVMLTHPLWIKLIIFMCINFSQFNFSLTIFKEFLLLTLVELFEAICNTQMNLKLIFCWAVPTSIFRFTFFTILFTHQALFAISKFLREAHLRFILLSNQLIKLHHWAQNTLHNLFPYILNINKRRFGLILMKQLSNNNGVKRKS
jgi:hypothetical protein